MTSGVRNTLLVGSMLFAAVTVFFSKQSGKPTGANPSVSPPLGQKIRSSGVVRPTETLPHSLPGMQWKLPEPTKSPHSPGSAEDTEWTNVHIAAIHELEWFDDSESLRKILAELRSPVADIRTAALEATRAFGSREAIPHLATRAAETGDPLEQRALNELIEYLKLPTVVEQLDQESQE